MYLLTFYVPEDHAENVKAAIFATGVGQVGNYAACSWQTLGQGQFQPLAGSKPFIGNVNQITAVLEIKVEMICVASQIPNAIQALKNTHPYETPAYHVIRLEDY